MASSALQFAAYLFLAAVVALGGRVWCPCEHAGAATAVSAADAATPRACCALTPAQPAGENAPAPCLPQNSPSPYPHCDTLAWLTDCDEPAAPQTVFALSYEPPLSFLAPLGSLACERAWPARNGLLNPGLITASPRPAESLRAVCVLLTV